MKTVIDSARKKKFSKKQFWKILSELFSLHRNYQDVGGQKSIKLASEARELFMTSQKFPYSSIFIED